MPSVLRMPSEADLPPGDRRSFALELFRLYGQAGRPTLRQLADHIAADDELEGTASRETIRRTLLGLAVPTRWPVVLAIYLCLCHFARVEPYGGRFEIFGEGVFTRAGFVRSLWNRAIDDTPAMAVFDPLDEPPF